MSKLAPSILAADLLDLKSDVASCESVRADMLHFDVMDGVFVPNISFGPALLKAIRCVTALPLDAHLMLRDPLPYIEAFQKAGADAITVHEEAEHFAQSIDKIKSLGLRAGASLKPATPVNTLKPYLDQLDLVLIMTVEPGFGGQKLMPKALDKLRELRALGFRGQLSVDGGVNHDNAKNVAQAGADALIMGTAFFSSSDRQALADYVHGL